MPHEKPGLVLRRSSPLVAFGYCSVGVRVSALPLSGTHAAHVQHSPTPGALHKHVYISNAEGRLVEYWFLLRLSMATSPFGSRSVLRVSSLGRPVGLHLGLVRLGSRKNEGL